MTTIDAPATTLPWHLRDNWAPVLDERTDTDLRVDGTIPDVLQGTYVRTGPNPASGKSDHWFFGDGMVHGVRIAGGRAEWYRNRFVQTPNITDPDGGDVMANMADLTRGTANTHVLAHNNKLLCLEEGHWPWTIDTELNTLGYENFGGALTTSMTAHPKVCPVTGELIAFSYMSPEPPYLHYIRISADGVLQQLEGIDIPNMVMMHDFNVTQNHVVFMDLPVCFNLGALETGVPFQFNRDAGARLGVMPRNGTNADVRWFEIDPCYVFHPSMPTSRATRSCCTCRVSPRRSVRATTTTPRSAACGSGRSTSMQARSPRSRSTTAPVTSVASTTAWWASTPATATSWRWPARATPKNRSTDRPCGSTTSGPVPVRNTNSVTASAAPSRCSRPRHPTQAKTKAG